jgi:hypothetical protein
MSDYLPFDDDGDAGNAGDGLLDDGWGDDDDFDVLGDEEEGTVNSSPEQGQGDNSQVVGQDQKVEQQQQRPKIVVPTATSKATSLATATGTASQAKIPAFYRSDHVEPEPVAADGWDDDDDAEFFAQNDTVDFDNANNTNFTHENAWEEDEEDLQFDDSDINNDDDEKESTHTQTALASQPPSHPPPPPHSHPLIHRTSSQTHHDLETYVNLLPYLKDSVTAVLEAEYNTTSKAIEVVQYFMERPGLVDYTIEKELPRMEYLVIQSDGMPVHEKEHIASWMRDAAAQGSLLPRCANQSLLADLLQAMTGTDLLVRPQYLATAVAVSCNFVIDTIQNTVIAKSNLELFIPTEHGRWKMADVAVFCQLVIPATMNATPSITYRIDLVKPMERNATWHKQFDSAVSLISNMEELHPDNHHDTVSGGMHYRDAFLQQSQTLIQNSTVGLRSALKEIDAVAGISHKLSNLPSFLPEDVIEAAEREHANTQSATVQPTHPEHRPSSILGGFLSSGLTRLAQTVTLPQEEDPTYYQEWRHTELPSSGMVPPVTNVQDLTSTAAHSSGHSFIPKLYRRPTDDDPPKAAPVARGPQLYRHVEPGLQLYKHDTERITSGVLPTQPHHHHHHHQQQQPQPQPQQQLRKQQSASRMDPLAQDTADGWDIQDDDLFTTEEKMATLDAQSSSFSGSTPAHIQQTDTTGGEVVSHLPKSASKEEEWVYDPQTDIRPTRKRWTNPHPCLRTPECLHENRGVNYP